MARKETVLNEGEAEKLGMLGATYEEMAAWFGVSCRTIERRMALEKGAFCRAYKKGLGRLKVSLRRQQIELANRGNPTMLIWLGKQLLEQQDRLKSESAVAVKSRAMVKLTEEDEEFLKRKSRLVQEGERK